MKLLKGVVAPITTPFYEGGGFALPMLESNIERYAVSGIHGYLALGSNGENKSLTTDEKLEIVKCVARRMGKNQFLIAGSIFESTRETIDFAQRAINLGAEFIALLPPSYFKSQMKENALVRYFTDVASAVGVPCTLYNAPQFSGGLEISAAIIKRCIEHPNIVGIKDSTSGGIEKLLSAVPDEFRVLSGTANTFLNALINGGVGVVASLANAYPVVVLDVYDAYISGDYAALRELNRRMIRLNGVVSGAYGVAAVKYAMDKNGFYGGDPRLPLLPLTDAEKAGLDKAIDGIIG
ncbi:MAG: dihydrodipicolinate synthase family protein [Oscillospiraceae bacterium]|nr:dihydrodipicolinate synthase family protein [Oscillospiraceae bacterium]